MAYINCIKPVPFRNLQNIPANSGGSCLEEKSIADLISGQGGMAKGLVTQNPFEVVRKPPKKRKKVEESCFVNEALNLSQPEKPINPYEVHRPTNTNAKESKKEEHSFVNHALNLKAPEAKVINPFEIVRCTNETRPVKPVIAPKPMGIENPALDVKIPMAIAVPFTPTINHRIDFGLMKTPEPPSRENNNQAQLTPSEMLSKKLVFSPKEQNCGTPKLFGKSLSIISEENTVNIDEELDCYQLELENSMNEAKLNNRKYFTDIRKDVLKKSVVMQANKKNGEDTIQVMADLETSAEDVQEDAHVVEVVEPSPAEPEEDFEEVDDDSFNEDLNIDNGNYQPFKRAYVRPTVSQPQRAPANGELMPPPPAGLTPAEQNALKGKAEHEGLKGIFRRSIRMITKPKQKKTTSKEDVNMSDGKSGHAIMSSIRRSLRKRKCRPDEFPMAQSLDMSVIIDGSRSVFKDPTAPKILKTAGAPTAAASKSSTENCVEKSTSTATSTLRNSIRRGKNNLMKNILHKKVEDYNFD